MGRVREKNVTYHQRHKIRRGSNIKRYDEKDWEGIKYEKDRENAWFDKLRAEYREEERRNRPSNVVDFRRRR